jgi:hypothetical protein
MTREPSSFWQIAGVLTLLAAYALAAALPLSSFPFDLFLTGALGLYFCSRWHVKGCAYAFMLLALGGICGHAFLEAHHFLRFGIEASFACSFLVAALSFEQEAEGLAGLRSQFLSRAAAIQNLEDEIGKVREAQVETQISSAKKIDDLQKNYEEISAEKSSLEILNDVLRKANAAHFEEKTAIESRSLEDRRRLASAQNEIEQIQNELASFKKVDLAVENQSLLRSLNSARFEKEQTRLINEMLVRLHASESIRAQEAGDRLKSSLEEKRLIDDQIGGLQGEISQLTEALSKSIAERGQMEARLAELKLVRYDSKEVEEIKLERAEIQQRLTAAEEKILDLAKVESLYKQLKAQFVEKNHVLHEARSALFKAETELQTLTLKNEEQSSLLPEFLRVELDRLDKEIEDLQKENMQLQDLVTYLTETERQSAPALFSLHRTPLPAGQPSLEDTLREALIPKRKKKAKNPA